MGHALVLGGGGVAGIAWEIGLLAGLDEAGVTVRDADLVVGTSAGSAVAAQLASGLPLAELLARQVDPAKQAPEIAADIDMEKMAQLFGLEQAPADRAALRRQICRIALLAETVSEADRHAVIEARVPVDAWPDGQRVLIVAVDANTGEERVFDRDSGVGLVDAVAASCAVPAVWPPVTIGDTRYVDGGVRSAENADLAAGHEVVLVLQAMAMEGVTDLEDQVESLRSQGSTVLVVTPDAEVLAAMGANPLDPAVRTPTATAAQRQGAALATEIAAFWR
ncbi:patatin-like phospholipase family protein [Kutzneria sp. CA-103260]|uniref:patatin-like phospholipase family protein n=1 Tax=Kutzneria sp. CA-103260 TaxID=2802641 RepID=UPI001BA72860|nr:patatin-like phospholipase family protein [Kutzneria sp. CA-103260]QUQ63382.1 patatin-like phospholipase [Kutzneria sp. CA-103260]